MLYYWLKHSAFPIPYISNVYVNRWAYMFLLLILEISSAHFTAIAIPALEV